MAEAGVLPLIDEGSIDLVRNNVKAVIVGKGDEFFQLGALIDGTGGIIGAVEDQGAGALGNERLHRAGLDLEIGIGIDADGGAAGHVDEVAVGDKIGVRHDHLIALTNQGQDADQQAAGGPGGDKEVAEADPLRRKLVGDEPAQFRNAARRGIAVAASEDRLDALFLEKHRHVKVGFAD